MNEKCFFELFGVTDYVFVFGYFVLLFVAGFYNRSSSWITTWLPVGSSLFLANMGAEYFIGMTGSAATSGVKVFSFELLSLILLQICSWIFLPVFIASKTSTVPAYMSKRLGGRRIRIYLSIISLFLYIFTRISVNLFAGALLMRELLYWNTYLSIAVLLMLTLICSITGSLTNIMQCVHVVMVLLTSGILTIMAIKEIGGLKELFPKYLQAIPDSVVNITHLQSHNICPHNLENLDTCSRPSESDFHILGSFNDRNIPWTGFILGQTITSFWFWCTEQTTVRRLLITKSLSHAQASTIIAGLLKILPLFFVIIPGMASRILYTNQIVCSNHDDCYKFCGDSFSCTNSAYPSLISGIVPSPLKGIYVSVFLVALVFDLTSVFQTSGQLLIHDVWLHIRVDARLREIVIVRRTGTIIMIILSVAWVPVIQRMDNGQVYFYVQDVLSTFVPSISAVFVLTIGVRIITEPATFVALIWGLFSGLARMAVIFSYPEVDCGETEVRPWFVTVHFMYFAMFQFWITIVICLALSFYGKPLPEEFMIRTTFAERHSTVHRVDEALEELNCSINERYSDYNTNDSWLNTTPRKCSISLECFRALFSPMNWYRAIKNWALIKSEYSSELSLLSLSLKNGSRRLSQNVYVLIVLFVLMFSIVFISIGLFICLSTNNWWKIVL